MRLFLFILGLCLSSSMADDNEAAVQEFTSGNNLFTAAIYKEVLKESKDKNFLVSPFSVETVLALTQSGAVGPTAEEIRTSLHLPASPAATEAAFSQLLPQLKGSDRYALHTANKIYIAPGLPLNENYKGTATRIYQSGIENIDFTQKIDAANTINKWVEDQTNNKIKNLIDPTVLGADTVMVLINALYFKGRWSMPFEALATSKQDFFAPSGVVQVDTMANTDVFNYYESPELSAKFLELPYQGNEVSMVIVLPDAKDGLGALENQLDKVFAAPKFSPERVSLTLPKFTIENKIPMKKILQNLGMNKAFTVDADFSGIAGKKGDLFVSDVIQKAFINVTEKGTEAAAATAAVVVTLSLPPYHQFTKEFKVDHPFIFYLKVKQTNLILFVGRHNQP